ncbi:hypothetical protein [Phocaeicola plebeius]|uniref:hypothetical protein n=1 Tax=Phocaeicola plebeius TaxID=310297 RepID=UPI0026ED5EFF|nr:hypothetical protein [Phocaeicola plebeius]
MIGYLLLLIALLLYIKPKYRHWSFFLYLSFMMGYGGGFGLWTDDVLGAKNGDLAIIYTFVISIVMVFKRQYKIPKWSFVVQYKWFILFLIASVLFSLFYYHFTPFQILQGGRSFLLIFAFPILVNIKQRDFDKVLQLLIKVCVLTSMLYILQTISRHAIMPYGEFDTDPTTGLPRFYNSPANLDIFLALTFLKPELFKGRIIYYRILFFLALVCTLGRTQIITTILLVFIALFFDGKIQKIGKYVIVIGVMMLPFIGVLSDRFTGDGASDFSDIQAGNFKEGYVQGRDQGTLLYRFAWVYERYDYIIHRPLGEQLFGLGLISDSQPWVDKHYNFKIGLPNPDGIGAVQLSTPDISYGNIMTRLGFLGGVIYITFIVSLLFFLLKRRKDNVFILVSAASIMLLFINSFSGSLMSETRSFTIYFLFLSFLFNNKRKILNYDKNNCNNISV